MKIRIRASGSGKGGVWVVPAALPLGIGIQLAPLADLSDFANVINSDGSAVSAVPAVGSVLDVEDVMIRRFHRREGEGDGATYAATPSFALDLVLKPPVAPAS